MGECASVDSQGCKLAAGETASTVRHLEAAVRCGASPFDHGEWNGRSDQALQGSSAIDSTLADLPGTAMYSALWLTSVHAALE